MEKLNREERGKIASVLIQSISKLCKFHVEQAMTIWL